MLSQIISNSRKNVPIGYVVARGHVVVLKVNTYLPSPRPWISLPNVIPRMWSRTSHIKTSSFTPVITMLFACAFNVAIEILKDIWKETQKTQNWRSGYFVSLGSYNVDFLWPHLHPLEEGVSQDIESLSPPWVCVILIGISLKWIDGWQTSLGSNSLHSSLCLPLQFPPVSPSLTIV